MKFSYFKEFRKDTSDISEVIDYLRNELSSTIRDLASGLKKLSIEDNFQSFSVNVVDLASQAEISIQNQIIDNAVRVIPSGFIIVRQRSGRDSLGALLNNNVPVSIVDGDTEWTTSRLYLKNVGTQAASFTVTFLR